MTVQQKLEDEYECCRCGKKVHYSKLVGIYEMGIALGDITSLPIDSLYCSDFHSCESHEARSAIETAQELLNTIEPEDAESDMYIHVVDGCVSDSIGICEDYSAITQWMANQIGMVERDVVGDIKLVKWW